jgi:hypothetical protein
LIGQTLPGSPASNLFFACGFSIYFFSSLFLPLRSLRRCGQPILDFRFWILDWSRNLKPKAQKAISSQLSAVSHNVSWLMIKTFVSIRAIRA